MSAMLGSVRVFASRPLLAPRLRHVVPCVSLALSKSCTTPCWAQTAGTAPYSSGARLREQGGLRGDMRVKAAEMSAGGSGQEKALSGPMLEPSIANNQLVRALVAVAAISAAAGGSLFLPANQAAFVHLTAFGIWFGTMIWHTFFVGLTMFKNMPRQMFGKVQAKMFPMYFGLTTGCNAIILASLFVAGSGTLAGTLSAPSNTAITLMVALLCSMTNWLAVEPACTKVMFERYDLENLETKTEEVTAKIKELYGSFGKWHGLSSVLNLIITGCAISHAWFLGSHIVL